MAGNAVALGEEPNILRNDVACYIAGQVYV